MSRTGLFFFVLALLATSLQAFVLFRDLGEDGGYPQKRSDFFTQDDIALRFGKRSGGQSAFQADDLALRFGR